MQRIEVSWQKDKFPIFSYFNFFSYFLYFGKSIKKYVDKYFFS